jgi:hypothetical protein
MVNSQFMAIKLPISLAGCLWASGKKLLLSRREVGAHGLRRRSNKFVFQNARKNMFSRMGELPLKWIVDNYGQFDREHDSQTIRFGKLFILRQNLIHPEGLEEMSERTLRCVIFKRRIVLVADFSGFWFSFDSGSQPLFIPKWRNVRLFWALRQAMYHPGGGD